MRVHELAKNLKKDKIDIVKTGKKLGLNVANSMTNLSDEEVNKIKKYYEDEAPKKVIKTEPTPRVDVEKIEKKLAKQIEIREEENRKEEERKKREEERLEKERIEREKENERKLEEEREKEIQREKELKEKQEKERREKQLKLQEKENQEKESNKKNFKNENKKKTKFKRKTKNFEEDFVKENTNFKRDLTKKTGNTVSKQKKAMKKDNKPDNKNKIFKINFPITLKEFAEKVERSTTEIITELMKLGIMATINENLDEDVVEILALELGIEIEADEEKTEEDLSEKFGLDIEDTEDELVTRAPVVTVMGHVDHGKTSLLDKIKSTKVTSSEAGGITQHIGAYTVRIKNKSITFIDTPGHEAFTMMRMRGAQITDVAILVVAADDGVMPQTIEAISHAKAAEVPIIVAINKIDKPTANPEKVKQELAEQGLLSEDWGGDTIMVPVSAYTGEGIDDLLEMILLVAEMSDLKANPNRRAVASIIEAKLDKGKGPVATVLVQNGTLKVGDFVASGISSGRIRNMTNDKGKKIKKAGPSIPVEIQGLNEVPNAGDHLYVFEDEKSARSYAEIINERERADQLKSTKITLDDLFNKIKEGELKELNLIVKADVKGSVEAMNQSILKLTAEDVKINIIHSGVGGINESDITLASTSNAIVIGFNVRPDNNSLELAKEQGVDIRTYTVIYKAIEDLQNAVSGMREPEYVENFIGRVEVRDTFKLPNNSIVAGGYVISGKITRDSKVTILRDNIIIHEGEVSSLKRFKDDVREVQSGYECGIGIDDFNDVKIGDIFEASIMEEVKND